MHEAVEMAEPKPRADARESVAVFPVVPWRARLRLGVMSRKPPSVVVSKLSKMEGVILNFIHDTVFIAYATGPISG